MDKALLNLGASVNLLAYSMYNVKPVKILNLNFSKKKGGGGGGGGKTVIYRNSPETTWDFSRSRMTKWIAPLESSHKI